MKSRKKYESVFATEQKYRAKMVKGKHGWLIKGIVFGTLLFGGITVADISVEASSWTPNTVEQITNRIADGQKSLTMIEGDSVYNIGLAINIKDPMQLLYDNGFKDGEQYTLSIGTVISWDGNHVTITDSSGNVVGDSIVSDNQKVDPTKTVAGQLTDKPESRNSTSQANSSSTNIQETPKPQVPNAGSNDSGSTGKNPSNPEKPIIPEKPVNPEKPVEPEKPVVPEQPDNQTELERLKALLAELETKLQSAEQELTTAQQKLENAQAQTNTDFDSEIAKLQNSIAEKEINKVAIENDLLVLENQKESIASELETAQAILDGILITQQQAQDAVSAAQEALDAIKEAGDSEQIANAESALKTAQDAYNIVVSQVAEAQSSVTNKQNELSSVESQIASKQQELANCDTSADEAKLAELQAQKSEQEQNSQSIAELEQIVVEKQKVVDDLKVQIEEVKQKIAAIELKVDREQAIQSLTQFTYLTQELVDQYVSRINSSLSKDEIQAIVNEASAKNEELKAAHESEQTAKELAKAKEQAVSLINGLTLSDQEKIEFVNQVNSATTIDEVNTIVTNAQAVSNQNEATQALEKAKDDAIKALDTLNLTASEKQGFVDQINAATSLDAVAQIANDAQAKSDANDQKENDQKELEAAKVNAKALIEKMNLTSNQKTTFAIQITSATTIDQVNAIVSEAQAISDQNDADGQDAKELAEAKTNALATLDTLNLKDQKQSFIDQVNTAQSVSVVDRVLEDAQKVSKANDEADQNATELKNAKEIALAKLDSLNLKGQLDSFKSQINAAKTVTEINQIIDNAQKVSDENDQKDKDEQTQKELEQAKATAVAKLNELNLKDSLQSYITQINNANSKAEIDTILANAQSVSDTNDQKDKDQAAKEKELADAKNAAITTINSLQNLSSTEKQGFINQVNAATTVEQVNAIVTNANNKNEENAPKPEKTLEEARKEANAALSAAKLGMNAIPFANRIKAATSVEELERITEQIKLLSATQAEKDAYNAEQYQIAQEEFMNLLNAHRAENGKNAVQDNDILQLASEIRAPELEENFDHTRPNGSEYYSAVNEASEQLTGQWELGFSSVAENINSAYFFGGVVDGKKLAEEIFKGWKASAGHNKNMLKNADYASIGFHIDANGNVFAVLLIGK